MNILFVTQQADMYGANSSLYHLMLDLGNRYNVSVSILMGEDGPLGDLCRQMGIEVFVARFYRWTSVGDGTPVRIKNRIKRLLNPVQCKRIRHALFADKQFDIIHTNSSVTDIGDLLAHSFGAPHLWHIREYGMDDYNMYYIYPDHIVRERYRRAAAVVAISNSIYRHYTEERALCEKASVHMIYNGVKIPPPYQKEYRKEGRVHFCLCGLLSENKNQIQVLEACRILMGTTKDFTLHIIGGGDEDYLAFLKDKAAQYGLSRNVVFWGFRKDAATLLKSMDVGIIPSKREAFGRVTIEYMLHYMPVIGANSGGTPELIPNGKCGSLYDLSDTEALCDSMLAMIESPEKMAEMGQAARIFAEENFSLEKNTDAIYHLYKSVLQKNGGAN